MIRFNVVTYLCSTALILLLGNDLLVQIWRASPPTLSITDEKHVMPQQRHHYDYHFVALPSSPPICRLSTNLPRMLLAAACELGYRRMPLPLGTSWQTGLVLAMSLGMCLTWTRPTSGTRIALLQIPQRCWPMFMMPYSCSCGHLWSNAHWCRC